MTKIRIKRLRPETANFVAWFVVGVLSLSLLIFGYAGMTISQVREEYEERAVQTTSNLALALEREIAGVVASSDIVLLSVIDEVARQQADGGIDARMLNAFIERQRWRFPYIDGIRLTDARGVLRYGSEVRADALVDISDREHFKTLRDRNENDLVISKPQRSRANNKWVIVFARRMNNPDGSFFGMAFIPITVKTLTRTFSEIRVPKSGVIALRGEDMGLIARYPAMVAEDRYVGQTTVSPEFREMLAAGKREGTFHATTPLDNIQRVLSFRKVADYPLYLIVGRAKDEYLDEWRRTVSKSIAMLSLFFVITLLLSLLVLLYWKKLTRATDSLERMAHTDFLTGLTNRRAFLEIAELELGRARRYGKPFSVLMLDIDHFKAINDSYGHEVGDKVLQKLAMLCHDGLREVDCIGRWGGEEFVVLLPETEADSAAEAAERIRVDVANSEIDTGLSLPVKLTLSIGHATLSAADKSVDELINKADEALYQAKNSGRNKVVAYTYSGG